jgi:hypothetical protein
LAMPPATGWRAVPATTRSAAVPAMIRWSAAPVPMHSSSASARVDVIRDFQSGIDRIEVAATDFGSLPNVFLAGSGADTVVNFGGGDRLYLVGVLPGGFNLATDLVLI